MNEKNIILMIVLTLIQCILITIIEGFSYPLLLLFLIIGLLTYISIEDWETGLISLPLNIAVFVLSLVYAVINFADIKTIIFNMLVFVLPFVLIELVFQLVINRGKEPERFLVGGGDMILFASMSMLLNTAEMMGMLFFASLFSLMASKIIKKSLVHFAPFIQIGFLIAFFAVKFIVK